MQRFLWVQLASFLLYSTAHSGTVAYYEFNGTGSALVNDAVTDSSGNGRNGTVKGAALLYGQDVSFGADSTVASYLSFTADSPTFNRVEIPGTAAFSFLPAAAYTVEVIFRTTQASVGMLISDSATTSTSRQWWLRHDGLGQMTPLVRGSGNEGGTSTTGTPAVNDGQWHHAAMIYTGTALQLYIDGVLRVQDSAIVSTGAFGGTGALILGEINTLTANRSFGGDIAAIRLSDTALAAVDFLSTQAPVDSNGDGVPDTWYIFYGLDPFSSVIGAADADGDGLTNKQEYQRVPKTNPNLADTDGDTLSDAVETATGTYTSANNTGTDPTKADTDGDGLNDSIEKHTGIFVSTTNPGTNPNLADTDADGASDGVETNTGEFFGDLDRGSNPFKPDSDGDTLLDGVETGTLIFVSLANRGTDPNKADTDSDGLTDAQENGSKIYINATNPGTNPTRSDSDGDGLADPIENNSGIYLSPTNPGTNPNLRDTDRDTISDGAELTNPVATNPTRADTDLDGFDDGVELAAGTHPLQNTAPFPSVDLTTGLFLYYPFNTADVADGVVQDLSRNPTGPRNAMQVNAGPTFTAPGMFGEAASFSGGANNSNTATYLNLDAHVNELKAMAEGTISTWVQFPTVTTVVDTLAIFTVSDTTAASSESRFFIGNGNAQGTGTLKYGARQDPGTLTLTAFTSVNNEPLTNGLWHHVAFTHTAASTLGKIYINGVEVAFSDTSTFFNAVNGVNAASIGRNKDNTAGGGQWFYNGNMDEFAIWSRPLAEAEIKFIHSKGRGLAAVAQPLLPPLPPAPRFFDITYHPVPNTVTLRWESAVGSNYKVETSTDLASWQVLNGNLPAATVGTTTTLSYSITDGRRFFRVSHK
jgi:hypothetical protein